MKVIGLLGGMSWESTVSYYQAINRGIKAELGGLHSAKIVLYSLDFAELETLQREGRWDETATMLTQAAGVLESAGADCLLICTNTMHLVAEHLQANIQIPLLHIADATAMALQADDIDKVGLLGTRFTMTEDFYKNRLVERFGIDVRVPGEQEQDLVHEVIYQELCRGLIKDASKTKYLGIIEALHGQGAQAVILGCTEIALLVQQADTHVPLYDTTALHAARAVEFALG